MLLLHASPHSVPENIELWVLAFGVFAIISYVLMCHAVAVYARSHGRSYLGAFVLSLLFNPLVGFIIVALLCHCKWFRRF